MGTSKSSAPKINHSAGKKKGVFYIRQDGERAAHMIYNMAGPSIMIIEHTQVEDAYEGHGYGKTLVYHAVEYARTHNLKIIPLCPFANGIFQSHEEIQDVLSKQK